MPVEQPITIILLKPSEVIRLAIPNKGMYYKYKAVFLSKYIPNPFEKVFDVVFPASTFERELRSINKRDYPDVNQPILMEFIKRKHSALQLIQLKNVDLTTYK